MRELDKNTGEEANQPLRRFHRGQLGRVLERVLQRQTRGDRQDYNLLELEQLWRLAAERDPAIGLHLFGEFTPRTCTYWPTSACTARTYAAPCNAGPTTPRWPRTWTA